MPHQRHRHPEHEFEEPREWIAIQQRKRRNLIRLVGSCRRGDSARTREQRQRDEQQGGAAELPRPSHSPPQDQNGIEGVKEPFDRNRPRGCVESEHEPLDRNPRVHEQKLHRQYRPRDRVGGRPEKGGHDRQTQHQAHEMDGPDAREPRPVEARDGAPVG